MNLTFFNICEMKAKTPTVKELLSALEVGPIGKRIEKVIYTLWFNPTSFSKELGMAGNATIHRAIKDDTDVQSNLLTLICHKFPDVNEAYLLAERGPVLKSQIIGEVNCPSCQAKDTMIKDLNKIIADQKRQIDECKARNEKLKAEITRLL